MYGGNTDAALKSFIWDLAKERWVLSIPTITCFSFRHQLCPSAYLSSRITQWRRHDWYDSSSFCPGSWLTMIKIAELSQKFREDGMLAYVELIQRKEKEIGCDVLTHQKWSVR